MKLRMFGYSYLFRSRWIALIWAAGIVWIAIELAGPDNPVHSTNVSFPITE